MTSGSKRDLCTALSDAGWSGGGRRMNYGIHLSPSMSKHLGLICHWILCVGKPTARRTTFANYAKWQQQPMKQKATRPPSHSFHGDGVAMEHNTARHLCYVLGHVSPDSLATIRIAGLQILLGGFWWLSSPLRMQGERSVGALKLPAAMAEVSASHAVNAPQIPDTDRRNLWLFCISEKMRIWLCFC